MLKFNVRVNIKTDQLHSKRTSAKRAAQMQVDQDVLKDSNYYAPQDEGTLIRSGVLSSLIGKGRVIWNTVYARRLYYNPQYNFSKDRNPNAQGLWFEAAKAEKKDTWLKDAKSNYQRYFNGK